MGLHQIFRHIGTIITRIKSQLTKWKKVFVSYSTDKSLISRIYKELKKLNSKTNNVINKWANKLNSSQKKSKWLISTQRNVHILSHKGKSNQTH
jgi:uridine kinase